MKNIIKLINSKILRHLKKVVIVLGKDKKQCS